MTENKKVILSAINGSIQKWKDVVYKGKIENGINDCPLCQLFNENFCFGCPIAEQSNDLFCSNTPYVNWCKVCGEENQKNFKYILNKKTQDAANHMLSFLYDVRRNYITKRSNK